ncbi:hypothetical protein PSI23_21890 [Xenorhabdus sp. XENO-10]|uniref:Phage protein n=1 Tax=Xenorhabdus yunnanensis TaxID=3025878 RepID=A0ABT5LL53_9GAMM|nr:hypothetical protein [Xenorhabdus yunnanensis]MDC9591852.1 hypothetical protein [Xenorhabdus yunnanensis]
MNNKLQAAVEIAEEIEAAIFPVVTATQNEAEPDTYLMCRGIYRQSKVLAEKLREVAEGNNQENSNNESLHDKLEVGASEIEALRTYLTLLLDTEKAKHASCLLGIALDLAHSAGKEIARVRGVEYS